MNRRILIGVVFSALIGFFPAAVLQAATPVGSETGSEVTLQDAYTFESPQQEQLFQQLTHEIRCLTCPNQNIAESGAGLAKAIKAEVYERIIDGEDAETIRQALIEGYGDAIDYKPRFSTYNALLWCAPVLFGLIGFLSWRAMLRSHAK